MSNNYAILILEDEQKRLSEKIAGATNWPEDVLIGLKKWRLDINIALCDLKGLKNEREKTALQQGDF